MAKKRISLELRENNKLVRFIQVIFGLVCLAISVFWLIYNLRSVSGNGTLWITLLFLTGFGVFQIYSGLGYAEKYIESGEESLTVKHNSLLPAVEMKSSDIESAEVFPLKVLLILKSGRNVLIRLGVTDSEKIDLVKDEVTRFVTEHNIPLEIKNE
jgi:hypothetical protein